MCNFAVLSISEQCISTVSVRNRGKRFSRILFKNCVSLFDFYSLSVCELHSNYKIELLIGSLH